MAQCLVIMFILSTLSQTENQCLSRLPPTRFRPSYALMTVWHMPLWPAIGPTLSSCDGIVRLNFAPVLESVNEMSICAGSDAIFEHAMPYMP